MIAEAQPNPETLSQFWLIVSVIISMGAAGIGAVCSIIMVSSNKKQRREVTFGFEPVSKKDFDEARLARDAEIKGVIGALNRHIDVNRVEHENMFSKLGGVERGARAELHAANREAEESRRRLHQEIGTLTVALGRVEGQLTQMNENSKKEK